MPEFEKVTLLFIVYETSQTLFLWFIFSVNVFFGLRDHSGNVPVRKCFPYVSLNLLFFPQNLISKHNYFHLASIIEFIWGILG